MSNCGKTARIAWLVEMEVQKRLKNSSDFFVYKSELKASISLRIGFMQKSLVRIDSIQKSIESVESIEDLKKCLERTDLIRESLNSIEDTIKETKKNENK